MTWLRTLAARIAALFRRNGDDTELNEELQFHLEMEEAENRRKGMTAAEARRAARLSFGHIESTREEYREALSLYWLDTVRQDLRYAVRTLVKSPSFTLTAVLTLALGVGATTAVFSIVYAVMLRPAPYPQPDRLLWVTATAQGFPNQPEVALLADFVEWRERAKSFSHIAAYSTGSNDLADAAGARRIQSARVTTQFLSVLGVRPALGRDFTAPEEEPGAGRSVILTHPFWQQQFGGDPSAVGRQILLDDQSYTVAGVLPADFIFPLATAFDVELLRPMEIDIARERLRERMMYHHVVGRLAPTVTTQDAAAELDVIRSQINEQSPQMKEWELATTLRPLHEQLVGDVRTALWVLFAAVSCVLLIACLNVGSLLLARSSPRSREMAIRSSLGAGRTRLFRQMLTEAALLAAGGSIAGLFVAVLVRRGLEAIRPAAIFHANTVDLNLALFAFLLTLTVGTVVATGLLPALTLSSFTPAEALKRGAANVTTGRNQRKLLGPLVACQLSLTVVLLVAAALLIQSFQQMRFKNLGYRTEGVLTASLSLNATRYPNAEQQRLFFDELLNRVRALPGVERAALSAGLPPWGRQFCSTVYVEGTTRPELIRDAVCVSHQPVSPGYFAALEIPLLMGRNFEKSDPPGAAIVNASFARTYFGAADPIGQRFRPPRGEHPWRTVIGVAADSRNHGLTSEPEPHVYLSLDAEPSRSAAIVLTSSTSSNELAAGLRHTVAEMDPAQAMGAIETLDQRMTREVSRERFLTYVLTVFGVMALLLAAIGVHGVTAYVVKRRTQEIGIRLALGATPDDILRTILGDGAKLLVAGVVLGLMGAAAATRLLAGFLFQISAIDARTFLAAVGLLAAVALFACYRPAKLASRTDPLSTLRYE